MSVTDAIATVVVIGMWVVLGIIEWHDRKRYNERVRPWIQRANEEFMRHLENDRK